MEAIHFRVTTTRGKEECLSDFVESIQNVTSWLTCLELALKVVRYGNNLHRTIKELIRRVTLWRTAS